MHDQSQSRNGAPAAHDRVAGNPVDPTQTGRDGAPHEAMWSSSQSRFPKPPPMPGQTAETRPARSAGDSAPRRTEETGSDNEAPADVATTTDIAPPLADRSPTEHDKQQACATWPPREDKAPAGEVRKLDEATRHDKPPVPATGAVDRSGAATPAKDGAPQAEPPATPAEQLKRLREKLAEQQRTLQAYEPLKAQIENLTQRIAALEQSLDAQPAALERYAEFQRSVDRFTSEIRCFVPTARSQLALGDQAVTCIKKVIAEVDDRITQAVLAAQNQRAVVLDLQQRQRDTEIELAYARGHHDFLATALEQSVTAQRDDLAALKELVLAAEDPCEAWFHLDEMDRLLSVAEKPQEDQCYSPDLNLGLFLACWPPQAYAAALSYFVVLLNEIESRYKYQQAQLDTATRLNEELDALATEATGQRRQAIVRELKLRQCSQTTSAPVA